MSDSSNFGNPPAVGQLDQQARIVVISRNPNSGRTDRSAIVDQLVSELVSRNLEVILLTDIEEVKTTVVEQASLGKLRTVVAAGGDGTVSLLANNLPEQTPIAIMPLGTENLLAKYLGITADPIAVAEMISSGKTAQLDAGRANGKLFLVMASCGFDADVVHRLHSQRKGHINHLSYAKPIVKAIGTYRYPTFHISNADQDLESDDETLSETVKAKWAFIFNVPRYAMNLPIVSDADPCDGKLDLCTFRGGNLVRGLFYLSAVLLRQHRKWKYSHLERFRKLRIESASQVPYQLDGDPGGVLPLEIEAIPQFLKVLVPSKWAAKELK